MFLFVLLIMKTEIEIDKLRETNPKRFAALIEEAGYKSEALKYYRNANDERSLYHATELAIELKKYSLARKLIAKTLEACDREMKNAQSNVDEVNRDPSGRGLMGVAMCYWSRIDFNDKLKSNLKKLEEILQEKGK